MNLIIYNRHYWRRPLCRGPEALGKAPLTLGKGFVEALGKELSENFESAKRVFAEGWSGTRQRKAAVTAPAPGTESLPRAVSGALGKELFFFF